MNSIIDPMWFYWIDVFGTLKNYLSNAVFCSILLGGVGGFVLWYFISEEGMPKIVGKYYALCLLVLLIISVVGSVFIPSQETMYKMLIAKTVTYENIEKAEQTIKDSVDYIFDKLDKK